MSLFTLLTGIALSHYLCCVFTDPGGVPAGWVPDMEGAAFVEVKKKARHSCGAFAPSAPQALVLTLTLQGGEARFCQKCRRHKPPRTHHCRQCDRCVLRMDHHCSWVNNCIGHGNYKAFFLFLLCAFRSAAAHEVSRACATLTASPSHPLDVTSAVLHGLVLLIARSLSGADAAVTMRLEARQAARERSGEAGLVDVVAASAVSQTLAMIVCVLLVVALGLLLGWHVYLIANNKTTVEYHEGVRARRTAQADAHRRSDAWLQSRHIYDLGLFANVQAALGQQARACGVT